MATSYFPVLANAIIKIIFKPPPQKNTIMNIEDEITELNKIITRLKHHIKTHPNNYGAKLELISFESRYEKIKIIKTYDKEKN